MTHISTAHMIALRQLVSLFQGVTLTLRWAIEYKIIYFIHSPEGHRTTRNLMVSRQCC